MLLKLFFRLKKRRVQRTRRLTIIELQKRYPEKTLLKGTRAHYLAHREVARAMIMDRLAYFHAVYNLTYGRVSIRNQKSRWGSCSRKGNLNFNYRLLFLPASLRDYILVHELAHVRELNHSKRFWNEVRKVIPHYQKLRMAMRDFVIL